MLSKPQGEGHHFIYLLKQCIPGTYYTLSFMCASGKKETEEDKTVREKGVQNIPLTHLQKVTEMFSQC